MSHPTNSIRWDYCGDLEQLLPEALEEGHIIESGDSREHSLELFDNYDRHLTKKGIALVKHGSLFKLVSASDLQTNPIEGARSRKKSIFWWDFPESEFRNTLKGILKLRAATLLATVQIREQALCIRNEDGKIIVRLWKESTLVENTEVKLSLRISPLLGYESEADDLLERLSTLGNFDSNEQTLAWKVLQAVGKDAVPPSPKQAIQLSPEQTLQSSVTDISKLLITIARATESGIIEDIDSEFLHDYRVAVRKLRSVLQLVKGTYEKEDTRRLKSAFGDYARATNRLRDLDVYLLGEDEYRQQLPVSLREGLDKMFADFRKERSSVLSSVKRHFKSKAYNKSIETEEAWLDKPSEGERSNLPVLKVASKEIYKHYKLIRESGRRINETTPDEEVHELRIECKKLRYLLELFSSLYDSSHIKFITKKLKRLQETLGDFNDFSVQQESLLSYLSEHSEIESKTAAAVGGLITTLNESQQKARALVSARFAEFDDENIESLFVELFSKKGGNHL